MTTTRSPAVASAPTRVLLIDDDAELAELLGEYLGREGFALDEETDGARGVERLTAGDYQIAVLDVMLPGLNGFDVLRAVRATSRVPVLMLTARGDDVDRIVGLELGADDYLSKPFNPRELVARIRAVLRRTQRAADASAADLVAVDDVTIDLGRHAVRVSGTPVALTAVEFLLLERLMRSAGSVVRREDLARGALGRSLLPFDRSIDVHVSRVRKKLGPRADGGERIATLRAVGYLYTRSGRR